jgi:hypothetical protein
LAKAPENRLFVNHDGRCREGIEVLHGPNDSEEDDMTLQRMDNVGIVVESLDTTIAFFGELGMKLEGRTTIEGEWAGRVTGLASSTWRSR